MIRSSLSRGTKVGAFVAFLAGTSALAACSGPDSTGFGSLSGDDDSGPSPLHDGGGGGTESGPSSDGAGAVDTGAVDTGAPDTNAVDSGTQDTSTTVDSGGVDTGTVTSADGFAASRTACINKINALRATDTAVALQPYTLQNTDMLNTCVDTQATNDQSHNSAHWSFINSSPACMWGSPSQYAQNECETGYGTDPAGIEQCLQDMWDESLKPNCAGCVGCTNPNGCPNCDFSGTMGYECGHYVNMSAPFYTSVACGFAGAAPSSPDGWAVQNFE